MSNNPDPNDDVSLACESKAFVLVAAVLVPVISVALIVVYGFSIWIAQMFMGPPGH